MVRGATGLGAGFDFYEDSLVAPAGVDVAGAVQRPGGKTLDLLLPWLEKAQAGPFFLFFHIYEPHAPWEPPEPFKSRYADPYDGEVATSDAIVGRLLDELRRRGLYDKALVMLLSDHGEGLRDHGEEYHGILLYREVLHVPLVIKLPGGARAGERVAAPVPLEDVTPTLLEAASAPAPEGLGRPLAARPAQARPRLLGDLLPAGPPRLERAHVRDRRASPVHRVAAGRALRHRRRPARDEGPRRASGAT